MTGCRSRASQVGAIVDSIEPGRRPDEGQLPPTTVKYKGPANAAPRCSTPPWSRPACCSSTRLTPAVTCSPTTRSSRSSAPARPSSGTTSAASRQTRQRARPAARQARRQGRPGSFVDSLTDALNGARAGTSTRHSRALSDAVATLNEGPRRPVRHHQGAGGVRQCAAPERPAVRRAEHQPRDVHELP